MKLDFAELDEKQDLERTRLAAEAKEREQNVCRLPYKCFHCGEVSGKFFIHTTNHGMVFNGSCSKRLFINNRAMDRDTLEKVEEQFARHGKKVVAGAWNLAQQDLAWLIEHDFEPMDPWDNPVELWPCGREFDVNQVVK
jgi:hypothetical protein